MKLSPKHKNSLDIFLKKCRIIFEMPLPGFDSQIKMAPPIRREQLMKAGHPETAIKSSVLALFYPHNDKINIVFIRRAQYNGVHSGQIAFPGGRFEVEDPSYMHTSIRETYEEIGVEVPVSNILGQLSPLYIAPSNYLVFPFIGFLEERPLFLIDKNEVAGIIEVPFDFFLDKKSIAIKDFYGKNGSSFKAPCYLVNHETLIWGATAMMMSELVDAYKNGLSS